MSDKKARRETRPRPSDRSRVWAYLATDPGVHVQPGTPPALDAVSLDEARARAAEGIEGWSPTECAALRSALNALRCSGDVRIVVSRGGALFRTEVVAEVRSAPPEALPGRPAAVRSLPRPAEADDFDERLRNAVSLSGLTQAELSRVSGVDPATISRWLSGKSEPNLTQLRRLLGALNVDIEDLVPSSAPAGASQVEIVRAAWPNEWLVFANDEFVGCWKSPGCAPFLNPTLVTGPRAEELLRRVPPGRRPRAAD